MDILFAIKNQHSNNSPSFLHQPLSLRREILQQCLSPLVPLLGFPDLQKEQMSQDLNSETQYARKNKVKQNKIDKVGEYAYH